MKKILAFALALCTVLTLSAPTAFAAGEDTAAEKYEFPKYGKPVDFGEALRGELSITQYAAKVTKHGKEYIMAPDRGGSMYVFKLEDYLKGADNEGSWIAAQITTNVPIPTGMVLDSKGVAYVVGDSNTICAYNFVTGEVTYTRMGNYSAMNIAVDEYDNLYISTTASPTAVILKYEPYNGHRVSTFYTSDEFRLPGAMVYGDGHLYIQGDLKNKPTGMKVCKMDLQGTKLDEIVYPKTGCCYYMDYIDGVAFVGHSSTMGDGCVAFDTKTMQPIDIGPKDYILGVVTKPQDGKAYMNISGTGIYEYDIATRKATRVDGLTAVNVNLRIRDPYVDVDYGGLKGKCILTMASGGAMPILMSLEGQGFTYLETLVEEATSPATLRSMGSGVKNLLVPNPNAEFLMDAVPAAEVAIYTGGYLCASVGSYSPDLDKASRIDGKVFSNGHAQTDCLVQHNGKIYGAAYAGAYLFEYDPATDTFRELISDIYAKHKQVRIHCIVPAGNKIFFSTVPTAQLMGGCIGWYDLTTNTYEVIDEPMDDLTVISLAYDEKEQILYGAGSNEGGTQTVPTRDEGMMLVYDVANNKKLGEFSIRAGVNPHSDMVFDLSGTDQIPTYIAGVATDPATGKIWGLVSRTLFSMKYDRATGALKIHEEWALEGGISKNGYPVSGSLNWFPRDILFDGKGNMYTNLELGGGFFRFSTTDPKNDFECICPTSARIYCLGSDDNLYFTADGMNISMIALDKLSIVKSMIDGTAPGDWQGVVEARKAYNALTDEERTTVGEGYRKALEALEGAAKIFLQVAADRVIDSIDEIGVVTASTLGRIANARLAYNLLETESQALVSNYDALVAAENAFASIKAKTKWNEAKNLTMSFSSLTDPRLTGVLLQDVTYNHTNGSIWQYGFSTGNDRSMKFNSGSHLRLIFGQDDYLALRVRIPAKGIYDLSGKVLDWDRVPDLDGCLGAVYMFPVGGASNNQLAEQILAEVTLHKPGTESYVGSINFNKRGNTGTVGTWECEEAGEYLLVISKLQNIDGSYAYLESLTLSRQDPVLDTEVERVKTQINDLGKITKKSGPAIQEARILYDSLTEAQKELIYAPQLEQAEKAYADIMANNTDDADAAAIALVEIQINAIGEVTTGSGPAIQMAREAFDALSKKLQKKVSNADVLTQAEAAYAALTANTGNDGEDSSLTTVIVIIVIVVLAAAGAVVAIILGRKKKEIVGGAHDAPQTEESASEETPAE